ncbi:Beta-hexosaminidase 2 [Escovopsis weberi]|uniref:beta-N-acetylhexosaminidase n=1 Tax=Escovopsis weberi TaxID=150374 RepID=A0A0M9VV30_ESCWE|nr:Beta-hexosaminidase 2 [Escovopsis weberi]
MAYPQDLKGHNMGWRLRLMVRQIHYTTGYVPPCLTSKEIVRAGVSRAFDAILQHGFVPWMLRPRGSDFEPSLANATRLRTLRITLLSEDEDEDDFLRPTIGSVDESYALDVSAAGHACIEANSTIGVLRALETFTQLWFLHSCGTAWYAAHAPLRIRDAPRFPYRGMLLDVARHWFGVRDIERAIDGLAMNKMNFLHLHATDTQSWPLEVPALPLLAERGAYRTGLTYSPAQVRHVQEYGALRGVQVVLEIDMPGHAGVGAAYPEVGVAQGAQPWQWYCAQPPCGALRLNHTGAEEFVDALLGDVLPRIGPWAAYFHTGGDEYRANNSMLDPALRTNDTRVLGPLLQRFVNHAHDGVRGAGLVPMVWEEMVLEWNVSMGPDVIVQTWLGKGALKRLADRGHYIIDSSNEFYYLDCGRGDWLDSEGSYYEDNYPFLDWCDPAKNWKLIYSHDPTDGLDEQARDKVLGGELCVWTETIDPVTLDGVVWPRAGAAAEVWWSGRVDGNGQNRSTADVRRRLGEQRERMLARGIPLRRIKNQTAYGVDSLLWSSRQMVTTSLDTGSPTMGFESPLNAVCQQGLCSEYGTYDNTSSATAVWINSDYNNFLSDHGFGSFVNDTQTIGGLTLPDMSFGVVELNAASFTIVGQQATSFGMGALCFTRACEDYPTFLQQLSDRGVVSRRAFSVYLGDNVPESQGVLLIGGVDEAKRQGEAFTLDVMDPTAPQANAQPNWVPVAGMQLRLPGGGVTAAPLVRLMDTGSPHLTLPMEVYAALAGFWGIPDPDTSADLPVDCSFRGVPNDEDGLVVDFGGGNEIFVALPRLITQLEDGSCVGPVTPFGLLRGDPFLRAAYFTFDYDVLTVTMAQVNYTDEEAIVAL